MSYQIEYAERSVPARVADLGFRVALPDDWISHDLPDDAANFDDPRFLLPLALYSAPQAAMVFAFAARPAYEDGSVHEWAWYLLGENGITPGAIGAHHVGIHPAMVGQAEQASELGPMVVHFAFFEDGGRLVNLSLTAPAMLAEVAAKAWFRALESFVLAAPGGAGAPLVAVATGAASEQAAREIAPAPMAAPAAPVQDDGRPAWWHRAAALVGANQHGQAEALVREACPHQAFAACLAELYKEHMGRLRDGGDLAGAHAARTRAVDWIYFYASQATSGGEGTALSAERDAFLRELD